MFNSKLIKIATTRSLIKINNSISKRNFITDKPVHGNIKWDKSWSVKELLLNDKNENNQNELITEERLKQLSKLSMISIADDKVYQYRKDLSGFLNAVESIQSLNTDNVKPLHSILEDNPLELHIEQTRDNKDHEDILKHTTFAQGGFYTVPKQISSASHGLNKNKNNNNNSIYHEDDEF